MRVRIYRCLFLFILVLVIGSTNSCKKEEAPENPYDNIDRSVNTTQPVEPDPNSIVGLHKNIFSPRCANPGCHDGTFEPDYRTVQSTFSTLVYQPVNKTTLDSVKLFSLRVIPHNTSDSWLIERLTTLTLEYMPSNGVRLTAAEIDHVKNWINNGCPDVNGVLPVKPNLQPNIIAYGASDLAGNRIDTIRLNNFPINPFLVQAGQTINMLYFATDSADGEDGTPNSLFTGKEIHFSLNKNDFSNHSVIQSVYVSLFDAFLSQVPIIWPSGTTVYFRMYVNDGDHGPVYSEFPRNATLDYYKTYYSLYVQ